MLLGLLFAITTIGPVCDATWHDQARNRDIPVRVRMPAPGPGKARPILFSHGLGGSVEAGTIWAKAWAEAGFVVIHIQHPGSDTAVLRSGDLRGAMNAEQLVARVGDVRFVLDQVERKAKAGECDLARADINYAGLAGHSFGAVTTQAIAGQSFRKAGGAELLDRRIIAAIAFSPSPPKSGGLSDADAFATLYGPFMSVTGSEDAVPLNSLTPQDRIRPFKAMPAGSKYLLWIDGANHAAFSGGGGRPDHGSAPDAHVQPIIARATTLFWRWNLRAERAAGNELDAMARELGPRDRLEKKD